MAVRHAVALAVIFACTQAHAQTEKPTRMKSPVLVASGVGVVLFGLAAGAGGGILTFWATTIHSCTDRGCASAPNALLAVALPVDTLSLAGIAGGIAMMTIGARRVPMMDAAPMGPECATSEDCGPLYCISGRCRGITAEPTRDSRPATIGSAVMFGDGGGYILAAAITDACALLTTIPPWMVAYAADASRFDTGLQVLPFVQLAAGPALHFFKGRVGPGFISLLGWSTVAATTYLVPTVVSPNGDWPDGLAAGTAMLLGGGTVMTIVDSVMARPHADPTPSTTWWPSIQPVPNGGLVGIAGAW